MKYLLDTHVLLWLDVEPERVPLRVRERLAETSAELFLSVASAWELAIKYALGKLAMPQPPAAYVPAALARNGVAVLPVALAHALRVADLQRHHEDPFDRLLVAQAELERMAVVTADADFVPYGGGIVWAGRGAAPRRRSR